LPTEISGLQSGVKILIIRTALIAPLSSIWSILPWRANWPMTKVRGGHV